jgi:tetratricopeptide (TPR) repeat protein
MVLGAYRDVDPRLRDPLAETLTELRRHPVTRSLSLSGLSEAEVGGFVQLTTGRAPARRLVDALHEATDGNPLFVGETLRLLTSEETLELLTDAEAWRRTVPEGVRAVIRRRLRRLPDDCRMVLVLGSVLGREFDLAALERVSEVGEEQLLEILDDAARERVVTDVPGQAGWLRFAHVLIRDTLYDELAPGRRMQLHRRVGDALEELHALNLEPHLAELAYHFYESARPDVAEKALAYARRAAERSLRLLAYEEAARLFAVGIQVLDRIERPNDVMRCDLLLALGDAYARAGDTPRSKQAYRDAARLAAELRLPDQMGHAALGYGGRIIWEVSRDDAHLVPLVESALAALSTEDSALRVRLLARLAGGPLRGSPADVERRRSLATEALEMARRIGDPSTLAYALLGYIASRHGPDFTPEQLGLAQELIEIGLEAGDFERVVEGYEVHIEALVELGDVASAHAGLEAMARLVDELGQPAQAWLVAVLQTLLALLEGRFDQAEELIVEARSLGERAQGWNAAVSYGLQLYLLRREQGRVDEVDDLVRRGARDNPTYPVCRAALTNMLVELGATAEARKEFEAFAADGFGGLPFDEEWEVSSCLLAEVAARLDEKEHAATLYELLLPYADRVAISYPEISLGPVSRFLGILATNTGHLDDAARHFEDALVLNERMGARPWLARAQDDYAQMLLGRSEPGDAERAAILHDNARAIYRELGMETSRV